MSSNTNSSGVILVQGWILACCLILSSYDGGAILCWGVLYMHHTLVGVGVVGLECVEFGCNCVHEQDNVLKNDPA